MQSDVGRTYPIHAGAAGKAMLALLPALDRSSGRGSLTPAPTITDPEARHELERIRQRGYARASPRSSTAPRPSPCRLLEGRTVLGAVNVAGPSNRWDRAKLALVRDAALAETKQMMSQLAGKDHVSPPASRARG